MELPLTYAIILQIANQFSVDIGCISIVIGIIGNAVNIFIFTHLKFFRTNRCVFYLIIESISDMINQLYYISITIFKSLYNNDLSGNSLILCRTKYIIGQSTGLIAFYMISLAAVDQFLSTNCRFYLRPMCTIRVARYLAFLVITVCIVHSVLFSFVFNIVPSAGCIISNPVSIQYATYFFYPVLTGFLPIVIASTFSILAYRNVRRIIPRQLPIQRRRFDRQITAMVLIRVIFFVIFSLPYVITRMYTINNTIALGNPLRFTILTVVQVITAAINNLNFTVSFHIIWFMLYTYVNIF
jgi:hypothetical protein